MFVKDNPEEDDATLEKEVLVLKPRKTLGKEEEEEGAGREAAGLGFDSFEIVAIVIQITNRARGGGGGGREGVRFGEIFSRRYCKI